MNKTLLEVFLVKNNWKWKEPAKEWQKMAKTPRGKTRFFYWSEKKYGDNIENIYRAECWNNSVCLQELAYDDDCEGCDKISDELFNVHKIIMRDYFMTQARTLMDILLELGYNEQDVIKRHCKYRELKKIEKS